MTYQSRYPQKIKDKKEKAREGGGEGHWGYASCTYMYNYTEVIFRMLYFYVYTCVYTGVHEPLSGNFMLHFVIKQLCYTK